MHDQKLRWARDEGEKGQTAAEYAIVLGVITLAIVSTLAVLSGAVEAAINQAVGLL